MKLNHIILITLSLIAIPLLVILNDVYVTIRLKEMKDYFQKRDHEESSTDHIRLIMKYNLSKKMYENRLSTDSADAIDFRISSLSEKNLDYENKRIEKYKYLKSPALMLINFNRIVIGKEPIRDYMDNNTVSYLDIAYFNERNNRYKEALENYRKALTKKNINRSLKAGIMLHQGFCNAMIGNFKKARTQYKKIIKDYSNENVAVTAAILLRYLDGFINERKKVLEKEADSIEKSDRLYKLMAYRESLKILDNIEKKASTKELAQIRYYKARCYDEIGETEKSVNMHLKVVTESPDSKYAVLANRKLYIIGSRLGRDNPIKKTALKVNHILKDEVLNNIINSEAVIKGSVEKDKEDKSPGKERTDKQIKNIIKEINIQDVFKKRVDNLNEDDIKKDITDYIGKRVKISTRDGNIFLGTVKDISAKRITLKSLPGSIHVRRDKVVKIEETQ